MGRKKKTDTSWLNSRFATCKEARTVVNYYKCENIMKERGWSLTDENGKPLSPAETLALIDNICAELKKEEPK